jgi:hypothetical protein
MMPLAIIVTIAPMRWAGLAGLIANGNGLEVEPERSGGGRYGGGTETGSPRARRSCMAAGRGLAQDRPSLAAMGHARRPRADGRARLSHGRPHEAAALRRDLQSPRAGDAGETACRQGRAVAADEASDVDAGRGRVAAGGNDHAGTSAGPAAGGGATALTMR